MISTNDEILALLDRLDQVTADTLEGFHLDFKPWTDAKSCMRIGEQRVPERRWNAATAEVQTAQPSWRCT